MTLELNKISGQIDEMGQVLAARAEHLQKVLPALRALRQAFSADLERLRTLAASPLGQETCCASPTEELLDVRVPAPTPPGFATIIAADGSQIYPDTHGWALYYLINIGSLVYRHGSGEAPQAATEPLVGYGADDAGNLLTSEQLSARRDVAEMRKLAERAQEALGDEPLVALLDSTLGLRAWSPTIPQAEQESLQQDYAAALDRLRVSGAALAGVVSRSRRAGAVSLLELASREEPQCPSPGLSPFKGITDQALWGDLRAGQRSALMSEGGSPPVYFFYLNTQPPDAPQSLQAEAEPARIEVPEWVALSREKLDWVHALVYDQCSINSGYPYALTRADELAIILGEEREAVEMMILRSASRQGAPFLRASYKEAQKRIARVQLRRRN